MTRLTFGTFIFAILLGVATPLLAADGWYLLIPPRSEYIKKANYLSGYKILDKKPLSRWAQAGSYDTAAECEADRMSRTNIEQSVYTKASEAYIKALSANESANVLEFARLLAETDNANVWALMGSRCIKSNDPRLAR